MPNEITALVGEIRVMYNDAFRVIYPATNAAQVDGLTAAMENRIVVKTASQYQNTTVYPNKVLCFESDTGYVKMGNGSTDWEHLPYCMHDPDPTFNPTSLRSVMKPIENTHDYFVTNDPIIPIGILAMETDRIGVKVGDGIKTWSQLAYRVDRSIYTEPFVIQTYNSSTGQYETVDPIRFSFLVYDDQSGDYVPVSNSSAS
jgi:hypothetical protein